MLKFKTALIIAITLAGFFLLFKNFTSIQNHDQATERLSGRYQTADSMFVMELEQKKDSLYGGHCFTAYNGSKIDCCLGEISISLKKRYDEKFIGTMYSCYDDTLHGLTIDIKGDSLLFILNDYHVFLPKNENVVFFRNK